MRLENVTTASDALIYLSECNLATVEGLSLKKSKLKTSYARHIEIAQISIDFLSKIGINADSSRVSDVKKAGSVQKLADNLSK